MIVQIGARAPHILASIAVPARRSAHGRLSRECRRLLKDSVTRFLRDTDTFVEMTIEAVAFGLLLASLLATLYVLG